MFHKLYPLLWRNSTRVFLIPRAVRIQWGLWSRDAGEKSEACLTMVGRSQLLDRNVQEPCLRNAKEMSIFISPCMWQKTYETFCICWSGRVVVLIETVTHSMLLNVEIKGRVGGCLEDKVLRSKRTIRTKKIINQPITFWDWLYAYRFKPNFE